GQLPSSFSENMPPLRENTSQSSSYRESHTIHRTLSLFEEVMGILAEENLTIKISKCEFFPRTIEFLGHIIGYQGMMPHPRKLEAISKLEPPRDVAGVRSVLGLFGYLRDYVPNYAKLTEPLTRLLKKKTTFEWGIEQDQAMKSVQDALKIALLRRPDHWDNLVLETDASDFAIGAMLHSERPDGTRELIECASHTLNDAERKWVTAEKEAFAIIWSLKHWSCYLRGRHIKVYTDHKNLQWMFDKSKGKIHRWALTLSEFYLDIYHKSGSQMMHVDCLSRNPCEDVVEDRMVLAVRIGPIHRSDELPTLVELTVECDKLKELPREVASSDGVYYYRGKLFVPPKYRPAVLYHHHGHVTAGHPGETRMTMKIREIFDWPKLREDIRRRNKTCLRCRRFKSGRERMQGYSRANPIKDPFQAVHMDFFEDGDPRILTMIERSTRCAEAALVPDKTADTAVRTFLHCWVSRFGVPEVIISDNDKAFAGTLARGLYLTLGIKGCTTIVRHPQGNSPVESFHRLLRSEILNLKSNTRLRPQEYLDTILLAYRSSYHTGIRETPAFLTYGKDISFPALKNL